MQTGNTSTGSHHFYSSFFNSARSSHDIAHHSAKLPIFPEEKEDTANGSTRSEDLDVDQLATASLLAQENLEKSASSEGDYDYDDFDAPLVPPSVSASFMSDNTSVSPAAMFLTAFSSTPTASPIEDGEGQVVSGYTFGAVIGYGAFSTIRRAYSNSGGVVAVKIIRRSDLFKQGNAPLARKLIQREAAVWSTLCHEHILPLFSVEHTSHAHYFFTLLCPAGSLFDILKRDGRPALPQDDAGMMFRQVVRGLRYLHEIAMYVHSDIKLENVMVDEMGVCRIGDFGMTRKIDELVEDDLLQEQTHEGGAVVHRAVSLAVPSSRKPRASLHVQLARHNTARHRNSTNSTHPPPPAATVFNPGSLPYASPELLLPPAPGGHRPHPSQDIWALGVLLYGLLTGRLPFMDSFEPRLQMKILNGVYDVPPGVGQGAERVLEGCLDRSVANRWTIAMVDEVAWGIGWGSEGDPVTPDDSDDEFESCHSSSAPLASQSRQSELDFPDDPEWRQEERRSRPSVEVASRRSTSRVQRSLSRVPVTPSRSSSKGSFFGRSVSRHSPPCSPSLSSLNNAILGKGTNTALPSCYDSALVTSPPHRGRRLKHLRGSPSRSPSPSPATPTDSRLFASVDMGEARSDDLDHEMSRGRKKRVRPLRSDQLYSPGVDTTLELDVLEGVAEWTEQRSSSKRSGSVPWRRRRQAGALRETRGHSCDHRETRFGSSPPSSFSTRSAPSGDNGLGIFVPIHRSRSGPQTAAGDTFLNSSKATPALKRSRSFELKLHGEERYARPSADQLRV